MFARSSSNKVNDDSPLGRPWLSVVIPCYNEELNIPNTVPLLSDKLATLVPSFELLLVNDASRDATGQLIDSLASQDAGLRAFHHPQNRGIGGGFVTGVRHARGDWFMLIPADLALDVNELHKYFDATPRADIVVGLRSNKDDYSFVRRLVSWTNITLIRVLFGMKERQFQYISLYRMEILRKIRIEYAASAFFFAEALIKAKGLGYRLTEVEISYMPRRAGKATGANPRAVINTLRDVLSFWLRWMTLGPRRAALAGHDTQAEAV